MARKLLRKLGAGRTACLITVTSVLSSLLLYLVVGTLLGRFLTTGFILSTTIPAVVTPFISYSLLQLLIRLDKTEVALAQANDELELRVKQRTAELVQANQDLQREIAERIHAEQRVQASLLEKEILLKEVYHRVKNNLQVVSSMLRLQARYIHDPQVAKAFKDSQNRIHSIALVHEKLYRTEELARIDLVAYTRSLVSHLARLYGAESQGISLNVQGDGIFVDLDTAIPCGLILNELVANSLQHAFPPGVAGEIRVTLAANDVGQLAITVSDSGVGLGPVSDLDEVETLGLKLVSTLVEQLEGSLKIEEKRGTTFRMTFWVHLPDKAADFAQRGRLKKGTSP